MLNGTQSNGKKANASISTLASPTLNCNQNLIEGKTVLVKEEKKTLKFNNNWFYPQNARKVIIPKKLKKLLGI